MTDYYIEQQTEIETFEDLKEILGEHIPAKQNAQMQMQMQIPAWGDEFGEFLFKQ